MSETFPLLPQPSTPPTSPHFYPSLVDLPYPSFPSLLYMYILPHHLNIPPLSFLTALPSSVLPPPPPSHQPKCRKPLPNKSPYHPPLSVSPIPNCRFPGTPPLLHEFILRIPHRSNTRHTHSSSYQIPPPPSKSKYLCSFTLPPHPLYFDLSHP